MTTSLIGTRHLVRGRIEEREERERRRGERRGVGKRERRSRREEMKVK